MLNIADFGGFSGIAKMIQRVKDTGVKLDGLASSTGVTEVQDLKTKYIDALDAFRPGNTDGVSSVATDFTKDAENTLQALKTKITEEDQLETAIQTFDECVETINELLGVVMNALKKAS